MPRVGPLSAKLVEDDETWLDTKVCRLLLRWFSLKGNYVGISRKPTDFSASRSVRNWSSFVVNMS